MKKVRFETFNDYNNLTMQEEECHSPRPFVSQLRDSTTAGTHEDIYSRILEMKSDPIAMFDYSNSSPNVLSDKLKVIPPKRHSVPTVFPSNELDLSMLDASSFQPRKNAFTKMLPARPVLPCSNYVEIKDRIAEPAGSPNYGVMATPQVLTALENKNMKDSTVSMTAKENSFFIRRDNLHLSSNVNYLQTKFSNLRFNKENNPLARKAELLTTNNTNHDPKAILPKNMISAVPQNVNNQFSHHCHAINNEIAYPCVTNMCQNMKVTPPMQNNVLMQCPCSVNYCMNCVCRSQTGKLQEMRPDHTHCTVTHNNNMTPPHNALEKKVWAIQMLENNKKDGCLDIEKSSSVAKEKREPTVADLFKIIKLQNEQLQLLQEKVDKFISNANNPRPSYPIQNYVTEQIALQAVENNHHKISIGVMTSFEMIRTSTVINKEFTKQTTHQNAHVQCNRLPSVEKEPELQQQVNKNFLDGIQKKNSHTGPESTEDNSPGHSSSEAEDFLENDIRNEGKALNEISLYNVHVDNATTPLISPEQTMYLDVRDYSDSDSGSDEQSNVGWTYYNKVMTHVNGMLQDSDMPSSASALFRTTKQQCVKMQIDKTNISVTKRVKFGDDPLGLQQQQQQAVDTSARMNQLAAKYLQPRQAAVGPGAAQAEMSFATRNYMERHQLLQGMTPVPPTATPSPEMPRFLDITALKRQQQHKLL
ncbi:hypothetical protein JYU34_010898 [Plutella xylostella]|uniref:Uncharacterized protein n=1 Tax=Plutella xylostella TaxID=51655 RepID=A0ABQ7QGB8_PLUXY|nr:hypothetical protein JYU34_010898 [Plutella xylostella]